MRMNNINRKTIIQHNNYFLSHIKWRLNAIEFAGTTFYLI